MARYNGLIIPRSYNDYYSRSDPRAIREIVAATTDAEFDATSENPVQNKTIAEIIPNDAHKNNKLTTSFYIDMLQDQITANYDELEERIGSAENGISFIEDVIPATASSTNELADKNFVNSTVGTNTANYIYKTSAAGENVPFDSIADLESYDGTVTQNDYAFVTGTDEAGNVYFDRYKANVTDGVVSWAKEYRLNNSSFTAEQWAAIQSGITSAAVTKLNGIESGAQKNVQSDWNVTDVNSPAYIKNKPGNVDPFDVCHPIGEIYVQFPLQTAPQTLYDRGTWTDITSTYAGLFFRAGGGDARTDYVAISYQGSSPSISVMGSPVLKVGDYLTVIINGQPVKRQIVTVTSGGVTVNAAFSSSSLSYANAMVTQGEGLPNIMGSIQGLLRDSTQTSSGAIIGNKVSNTAQGGNATGFNGFDFDASKSNSIYGSSSHVTPINTAITIWKRTA